MRRRIDFLMHGSTWDSVSTPYTRYRVFADETQYREIGLQFSRPQTSAPRSVSPDGHSQTRDIYTRVMGFAKRELDTEIKLEHLPSRKTLHSLRSFHMIGRLGTVTPYDINQF